MEYVCPKCRRAFEVNSPYCPACGAPMNENAARSEHNRRVNSANAALLPMKWHKFLMWVSLPLSVVLLCVTLWDDVKTLAAFDPTLYYEEMLPLVKLSLYGSAITGAISVAVLICAEILLIKKQWLGTRLVLFNYLFQTLYGIFNIVLVFLSPRNLGLDVSQMILSVVEMGAMFFLNRVYYNKRRGAFHPYTEQDTENAEKRVE